MTYQLHIPDFKEQIAFCTMMRDKFDWVVDRLMFEQPYPWVNLNTKYKNVGGNNAELPNRTTVNMSEWLAILINPEKWTVFSLNDDYDVEWSESGELRLASTHTPIPREKLDEIVKFINNGGNRPERINHLTTYVEDRKERQLLVDIAIASGWSVDSTLLDDGGEYHPTLMLDVTDQNDGDIGVWGSMDKQKVNVTPLEFAQQLALINSGKNHILFLGPNYLLDEYGVTINYSMNRVEVGCQDIAFDTILNLHNLLTTNTKK